ncbi:unnamed protein product [Prorocentrum cordatum]|uniref:Uncharacterized protein n=1 Tax=Prorocentrum cordatum TaxID=2364126 RepID=A0ABN9VH57_9DINO|nr:unnamed protein product [Polarella glacialis]
MWLTRSCHCRTGSEASRCESSSRREEAWARGAREEEAAESPGPPCGPREAVPAGGEGHAQRAWASPADQDSAAPTPSCTSRILPLGLRGASPPTRSALKKQALAPR